MIAGVWPTFGSTDAYWKSTVLMVTGAVLGVLFVSLMRRVMVEDPELPFPESTAAAEIHKAGQAGARAAKFLFWNMGFGAIIQLLGDFSAFARDKEFLMGIGEAGRATLRLGAPGSTNLLNTGGTTLMAAPTVSPAYIGVGYIIGPRLASLNFAGGVFAWGLLIPLFIYFLGPQINQFIPPGAGEQGWSAQANAVWRYIVRPIAVGGMLVGAAYTLFRMRASLSAGIGRAFAEIRQGGVPSDLSRTERYMSSKTVFLLIAVVTVFMAFLYVYFSGNVLAGIVATLVMLVTGFFFATVSGSTRRFNWGNLLPIAP